MSGALSRRAFLRGSFLPGRSPDAPGPRPAGPGDPAPRPVARIVRHACLAWTGTFCFACAERCPVPGALTLEGGRPVVDVAACDGCGACADVCPAPQRAIRLLPRHPSEIRP